jgi:hypothetical protein
MARWLPLAEQGKLRALVVVAQIRLVRVASGQLAPPK